jgi:hydroxymethylglutaryl-CoA lyase
MLAKTYPTTARGFRKWYLSNKKWETMYNKLGSPKPFDVTLRDGLQALSKEEQNEFTTIKKKELYKNICLNYNPKCVEIGSIVSEKVLPIFKDTLELYSYALKHQQSSNECNDLNNQYNQKHFILIPNKKKLQEVISKSEINHFAFITSVSNSFQKKNTNLSLFESDKDIIEMINLFNINSDRTQDPVIKLYVSCINECPIEGKLDNDFIVNRLLNLYKLNIDTICLSDTCGTLEVEDFEYIVDTCAYFGMVLSKLSLHLHVKPGKEDIVEQIIHTALDRKIINYDVSLLTTGGCSVTMKKENMSPNLSYELYYKSIVKYIEKKTRDL